VRYYERLGLIPTPPRQSGRREYGPEALSHLAVVLFARECGFTLVETRQLVRGFDRRVAASARWATLAQGKLREMDTLIERAKTMKALLRRIRQCRCDTLEQCGRKLSRGNRG
jgi:DNA-binding transcriptional MerR regulator